MKYKDYIIGGLIIIVVLMRIFQPKSVDLKDYILINGKEYQMLQKVQDTVLVEVTDTIIEYVPTPYKVIETEYVEIPTDIDTLEILKDFYSKRYYSDSVKVSEYGYGVINDTVTQNRITSRTIDWSLDIPVITNTITVLEPPRTKVYIGGGFHFDQTNFINSVQGGFLLKTKKDKVFGINGGINNQDGELVPFVGGSIYFKIKLKK